MQDSYYPPFTNEETQIQNYLPNKYMHQPTQLVNGGTGFPPKSALLQISPSSCSDQQTHIQLSCKMSESNLTKLQIFLLMRVCLQKQISYPYFRVGFFFLEYSIPGGILFSQ